MLNRKNPPEFVQSTEFNLIPHEYQTLPNGCELYFVPGGEQEVIKIEFIINAGKWSEPSRGITHFTSILLSKGTTNHSGKYISSTLDFLGIHLDVQPGFDFTSISLYGLSKNMPLVIDLVVDILLNPSIPETELQQAKDIYLQGLRINLEKTSFLASREFRKHLFGESHPYGRDIEINDLAKINRDSLITYHTEFFKDFIVFISGNISKEFKQIITDKLVQLKVKKNNANIHTTTKTESLTLHIDKNESIQTSLRIGKRIIGRSHPDYPGLLLLNHIVGGFFGSRLMKNIREEKGLTYGIHSSIHALLHQSYFVIGADVNKENKELTIQEIKWELNRLQENPIPIEELNIARNHFIGSLQTEMNSPFSHVDKIKLLILFGLPIDYFNQLITSLTELNQDQLKSIAEKHFEDKRLVTVSVG
jgi:zinc protease